MSLDILGLDATATATTGAGPSAGDPSLPTADEFDTFFSMNVDASGNPLPQTISYSALAKRIAPFGECFFFDYGVVVMWGLTEQEEKTVLRNLRPFEDEKLSKKKVGQAGGLSASRFVW